MRSCRSCGQSVPFEVRVCPFCGRDPAPAGRIYSLAFLGLAVGAFLGAAFLGMIGAALGAVIGALVAVVLAVLPRVRR